MDQVPGGSCPHMGDQDGASQSWLQPGPDLPGCGHLETEPRMENFSLSLSVSPSFSQLKDKMLYIYKKDKQGFPKTVNIEFSYDPVFSGLSIYLKQ